LIIRRLPRPTRFPYTTLFRSDPAHQERHIQLCGRIVERGIGCEVRMISRLEVSDDADANGIGHDGPLPSRQWTQEETRCSYQNIGEQESPEPNWCGGVRLA